jgi:hypothetical protein
LHFIEAIVIQMPKEVLDHRIREAPRVEAGYYGFNCLLSYLFV